MLMSIIIFFVIVVAAVMSAPTIYYKSLISGSTIGTTPAIEEPQTPKRKAIREPKSIRESREIVEKASAMSDVVETFSEGNRKAIEDNYAKIKQYVSDLSPDLVKPKNANLQDAKVVIDSLFKVNAKLCDLGSGDKVLNIEGVTVEQSYVESVEKAAIRLEKIHAEEYQREEIDGMEESLRELDALARQSPKSSLDL